MTAVTSGASGASTGSGIAGSPASDTLVARQIGVPPNRISQIVQGKRAITGDTALRLGHWFGNSPEFWLNLQAAYDLRVAAKAAGRSIAKLPTRRAA